MKKSNVLAATLLCISTASMATSPAWLADFNRADLNDSGGLSKAELGKSKSKHLQGLRTQYEAIDADKDGHVTTAEYEAHLARQTARISEKQFSGADLNDSGGLSRLELGKTTDKALGTLSPNFDRIDTDRDGQLTYAEYTAFAAASASAATAPAAVAATAPKDQCQPHCGVVLAVESYKVKGKGSALGVIAGGLAGGALGNQVGDGSGNKIATVGGAAGGAYLGHKLEEKLKTKHMQKITVRLDSGEQMVYEIEGENSPVAAQDRVQIVDGKPTKYARR